MIRTFFFAYFLVWTRLVSAQNGDSGETSMTTTATTATAAATKTSSSSSSIQTVNVGKSGLKFSPDSLTVAAGDKVEFHFFLGDHSVNQASFTKPCHPLSDSSFSSGFVTGSIEGSPSVFTLTVNDTKPIWFYCGQVGHCQAGMVGVINPGDGADTLAAFNTAAGSTTGSSVLANVQGGILGNTSDQSTSTSGSSASSPSTTNSADTLTCSTGVSVAGILALITAGFFI